MAACFEMTWISGELETYMTACFAMTSMGMQWDLNINIKIKWKKSVSLNW